MVTYYELEEEFFKKVIQLQENCKHEKTTWCEQCWAPGHLSGYKVKICDICNKRLEESPTEKEREEARQKWYKEQEEKHKGLKIKEV